VVSLGGDFAADHRRASVGYREQIREQLTGVAVPDMVPDVAALAGQLADSPHRSKMASTNGEPRSGIAGDATKTGCPAVRR
jgi:hypothetical protein